MSEHKRKKHITEVTWPVGPDGTLRPSGTDPLGMYTGIPEDRFELPVQDVDDL